MYIAMQCKICTVAPHASAREGNALVARHDQCVAARLEKVAQPQLARDAAQQGARRAAHHCFGYRRAVGVLAHHGDAVASIRRRVARQRVGIENAQHLGSSRGARVKGRRPRAGCAARQRRRSVSRRQAREPRQHDGACPCGSAGQPRRSRSPCACERDAHGNKTLPRRGPRFCWKDATSQPLLCVVAAGRHAHGHPSV